MSNKVERGEERGEDEDEGEKESEGVKVQARKINVRNVKVKREAKWRGEVRG